MTDRNCQEYVTGGSTLYKRITDRACARSATTLVVKVVREHRAERYVCTQHARKYDPALGWQHYPIEQEN